MNDLTEDLKAEMDRDLAQVTLTGLKPRTNGSPLTPKGLRMTQVIEQLIADHQTHIDALKRLKESL